jgi:hypothetical protein
VHAIPSWSTNIQLRILAIVKRKLPQRHEQKPKHASSAGRIVLCTRGGQPRLNLTVFQQIQKIDTPKFAAPSVDFPDAQRPMHFGLDH